VWRFRFDYSSRDEIIKVPIPVTPAKAGALIPNKRVNKNPNLVLVFRKEVNRKLEFGKNFNSF
jgi:hypothetical protein